MKWLKIVARSAAFPLIVLALLVSFRILYRLLGLPPSNELISIAKSYMTRYGYAVVFVGAFLEATPVVNFYLPGSTIIILAVALSREGYMNVFVVLAIATTAFLLSYILDYAMGRYGWYTLMLRCGLGSALDRAQKRVSRHGPKWIFPSYVHPNIGAITSTACGILRIPFSRFVPYSLVALIVWDSLWGALTYYESSFILRFANTKWLILVVAAWLLFVIIREIRSGSEE